MIPGESDDEEVHTERRGYNTNEQRDVVGPNEIVGHL